MQQYIGIIHKDKKSDYGISFPDFPGCISAGKTLDEARSNGEEALAFHVRGLIEDGSPIPAPSNLEKTMRNPDFRDGVAVLVPLRELDKAIRINITMTEQTLRDIDGYAKRHGLTRSGFLQLAAKKALSEDAA